MITQQQCSPDRKRKAMYVTVGSDFVEDYLGSIKLLQIIPTGLVKEVRVWILDVLFSLLSTSNGVFPYYQGESTILDKGNFLYPTPDSNNLLNFKEL